MGRHHKAKYALLKTIPTLLVALTLASCLGSAAPAGDDGGPGDESAEAITLEVFAPSSLDVLGFGAPDDVQVEVSSQVLEAFVAESDGVSGVNWEPGGAVDDNIQAMMTAHLSDEPIDLISCAANPTNGQFIRRGVVRDITEEVADITDRFDEQALAAYTVQGRIYGLPISGLSTSSFFYNKDAFTELGLGVPNTYEEMVQVADTLAANDYLPVLHQGATNYMWPMWYFETLNQSVDDAVEKTQANLRGESSFTDPEEVEAFAAIRQFVDDGIMAPETIGTDWDGMRSAFANQQAAIYYGGTWELGWLDENVTEFEYGVFPFPKIEAMPHTPGHGGGPDTGICISNRIEEDRLNEAVAFIEYITRPEVASVYLEPTSPIQSSIIGVDVADDEIAQTLQAQHYPDTVRFLDWIWPSEVATSYGNAIQGVVDGSLTPEDAAQAVQDTYDQLVADGYSFDQ